MFLPVVVLPPVGRLEYKRYILSWKATPIRVPPRLVSDEQYIGATAMILVFLPSLRQELCFAKHLSFVVLSFNRVDARGFTSSAGSRSAIVAWVLLEIYFGSCGGAAESLSMDDFSVCTFGPRPRISKLFSHTPTLANIEIPSPAAAAGC